MSVSGLQFQLHPPNDTDLDSKVKKGVERISENLHISANEPSLALYRLQEHVRRAAPPTVARRHHVSQLHSQLQGACYDVEYAVGAVNAMKDASPVLASMNESLKEAIYYRQQLKYEQMRRKKQSPSMYKRLSSHLTSLDLPDLPDIPDALRETASRMESAIHQARTTYDTTNNHNHWSDTTTTTAPHKNPPKTNIQLEQNTLKPGKNESEKLTKAGETSHPLRAKSFDEQRASTPKISFSKSVESSEVPTDSGTRQDDSGESLEGSYDCPPDFTEQQDNVGERQNQSGGCRDKSKVLTKKTSDPDDEFDCLM